MRVPISWLAEYVDPLPDVEVLAEGLTSLGLQVESIHRPGAGISGVVVGEVLDIKPHPNADKLILVEATTGNGPHHIVCGAHNFQVGARVPVALPGASLPGGLQVERREIRGESSDGMLCSGFELGVSEDHSGILVLADGTPLGADVREVLGLDEVILELDITPNRPDAMSLIGLARDVVAKFGGELKTPDSSLPDSGSPATDLTRVDVDDADGCPRYLAKVVTDVSVAPSPDSVQRRLLAAGMRPVSNVVDATNYALMVLGHPMHAFDLDRLEGKRIVVRRAKAGEEITTLDGEKRRLDLEDLVIADASRAVAIAGVMGGGDTEVGDATTSILLESAFFDPVSVLRTSKRHGLRTEASARFERGTDPNIVQDAADYACRLISDWSGGEVAWGAVDVNPRPIAPIRVDLRPERANHVLGTDYRPEEMIDALTRLGFGAERSNGAISATVPTRRPDVVIEEDLIEEVARLLGYERIPTKIPSGANRVGGLIPEQRKARELRRTLMGAGLMEAQTSTLLGPADLARLGWSEDEVVRLANPLSSEESLLRPSLLPGLIGALLRNVSRREVTVRFFELGHCFSPSTDELPREFQRIGLLLHGVESQRWHAAERELDFFDMKGVIELLPGELSFEQTQVPYLHPGRAARVLNGDAELGVVGELHPSIAGRLELPYRPFVAEVDLDSILAYEPVAGPTEVPRYPAVLLDIAVTVPEEVPAAALLDTVRATGGTLLESVELFDVYRGPQAGEGRKSVAISLAFRDPNRTLTDQEAISVRDEIARALEAGHEGQIRA